MTLGPGIPIHGFVSGWKDGANQCQKYPHGSGTTRPGGEQLGWAQFVPGGAGSDPR